MHAFYCRMENAFTNIAFNPDIESPVAFCCWKHHLRFIADGVTRLATVPNLQDILQPLMAGIGGTLIDMYIGPLSPSAIAHEVINHPVLYGFKQFESFSGWVATNGKAYRCLTISDGSRWVLRVGHYPGRFIHIHPGRNSTNTFRFRSTNLKVAIAFRLMFGWNEKNYSVDMMNRARVLAKLCPVGAGMELVGAVRVLHFLEG